MKRILSGITLTLLLTVTLALAFNVQPVKAGGTIYIRVDGSIDPPTANITTLDNVTYTFTGNVNDSIVVEMNNIVIDGAGFTMRGNWEGHGIDLSNRSHVTVKNVRIVNFNGGINLASSSNNNITGNILLNNLWGIYLWSSNSNVITNNSIYLNSLNGIRLNYSNNNTITENYLSTNNLYGIILSYSSNNTLTHNNITNNEDGIRVASSSDNNLLVGNNALTNHNGIFLSYASKNTLTANNLYNNDFGIYLWSSHNNTYANNNISDNGEGTLLGASRNNVIFHNNFTNNNAQASVTPGYANVWDDGYPSGGNYWSDYNGTDVKICIYQNETGNDGIGDTPYVIDADNKDRYPLMGPIYNFDAGIWNGTAYNVSVVSNSTISDFHLDAVQRMIKFNVTGLKDTMGFCRVTIPNIIVQSLWQGNYTILLNGEPWPFRNWTNTENTYIYINYTHSEHEITIVPEIPSTIILTLFMTLTMLAAAFAEKRVPRNSRPKSRNYHSSFPSP